MLAKCARIVNDLREKFIQNETSNDARSRHKQKEFTRLDAPFSKWSSMDYFLSSLLNAESRLTYRVMWKPRLIYDRWSSRNDQENVPMAFYCMKTMFTNTRSMQLKISFENSCVISTVAASIQVMFPWKDLFLPQPMSLALIIGRNKHHHHHHQQL